MWIIWDVIALGTIVLFIYLGAKKGFVRTLVSVCCYILAAVGAKLISPRVATWFYNNYGSNIISKIVSSYIGDAIQQGISSSSGLVEQLPGWLLGVIENYYPGFEEIATNAIQSQESTIVASATRQITEALSEPVIQVLSWIVFVFTFIALAIIVKQLAKLFTGVNYVPVVGSVNMVFGGGLGAVQAVVILLIVAVVLHLLSSVSTGTSIFLSPKTINSSFIMGPIYRLVSKT